MARKRLAALKQGDLVNYEGKLYRVIGRRAVTPLAMFCTCGFEVKLVSLDGEPFGYVAENEVEKVTDEESGS